MFEVSCFVAHLFQYLVLACSEEFPFHLSIFSKIVLVSIQYAKVIANTVNCSFVPILFVNICCLTLYCIQNNFNNIFSHDFIG